MISTMMEGDSTTQHPGLILRQARLRAGLSEADVAKQTKLLVSQVISIERGDFTRLPGEIFVIGYLRSYARMLGLDAEEILDAYQRHKPKLPEVVEAAKTVSPMSMRSQHRQHKTGYGVMLSLLVVAGLWFFNDQPEPDNDFNTLNVIRVDTEKGTTVVGPLEEYATSTDDVLSIETLTNIKKVRSSITTMGVATPVPAGTENTTHRTVAINSKLSFYFTGDCWVEVRDGDEKIIYANLRRADDNLQLQGKPPFRVILGYAPAVSLSYNGQPVDIDANRQDNMAKLILGNT